MKKIRICFTIRQAGLTVQAIKSSAWHGVPTIAFKFMTGENSLLFSADTVWKPSLWKKLYETRREQKFDSLKGRILKRAPSSTGT